MVTGECYRLRCDTVNSAVSSPDVSEEHATSIPRVNEDAKQEAKRVDDIQNALNVYFYVDEDLYLYIF